jgi:tricorn protease
VIPRGPTAQDRSRVVPGERLVAVDGAPVTSLVELQRFLTLDEARDVQLLLLDKAGKERKVTVRPVASVSGLLYEEWVATTRRVEEQLSGGKLGYLHIQGMSMPSFYQFEQDLFHAGYGKDGLLIDVRDNGGGSTADHVLTALTQPAHALTISRGSGLGYPQDRRIYASWDKPIVLMCNENSFSNAEILSHAVKSLGRGRVVGMRTAGGVISTGGVSLQDGSMVRMPGRGWFVKPTGRDMELNGCEPDIALWNEPDGPDRQLELAVRALQEDVGTALAGVESAARPVPASMRRDDRR